MSAKKINLDELINQAKINAEEDRDKTLEAYHKMKSVLTAETEDEVRGAMLLGPTVISLLEQLTRSNEQIVRLAQIAEKRESRAKQDERKPLDFSVADDEDSEEVAQEFENNVKAKMRIKV